MRFRVRQARVSEMRNTPQVNQLSEAAKHGVVGKLQPHRETIFMKSKERQVVSVRRSNSIGDVLAATVIADALMDMGKDVEFQCSPHCSPLLQFHPRLKRIAIANGSRPNVNLDGAYEYHTKRTSLHFHEIYRQKANCDLTTIGLALPEVCNWAPTLIYPSHHERLSRLLTEYPRPFVMVSPRSNSWANRTVQDATWREAAAMMNGTKFWLGNHAPAPEGFVDASVRDIPALVEWISCADMFVGVDSGPLHIAAALKKPIVALLQASSPELHLSNQRDFSVIGTPFPCLNCQLGQCNIPGEDPEKPPCQEFAPEHIAQAVNLKLKSLPGSGTVSAVIAVYKPDLAKLSRCLECVKDQVDEIIIAGDADTPWPISGIISDPKISMVRMSASGTGYGRKATFGARYSNGEHILQLNDDVYCGPNVVTTLLGEMKRDVAAVTHTLRYPDGKIQYAGKYRPRGAVGFGHIDHKGTKSRYTGPVEQEAACGASMLVRREAFFQANGFDERFLLYCEDDSLVLQMRQLGWRSIFTPLCESIHEEHQSSKITPGWGKIARESEIKFRDKWKWYFDKNPNPNRIGKF